MSYLKQSPLLRIGPSGKEFEVSQLAGCGKTFLKINPDKSDLFSMAALQRPHWQD